jgi:hypothetical protein
MLNELRKQKLFTDKGFLVVASQGEKESLAISKWNLTGSFQFESRDHFEEFTKDLSRTFSEWLGDSEIQVSVTTIDAFEVLKSIERSQGTLPIDIGQLSPEEAENRLALKTVINETIL